MYRWFVEQIIALVLLASVTNAFATKSSDGAPYVIMGRLFHGLFPPPEVDVTKASDVQWGWLEQILDHFDASDHRVWTQYYLYNLKWYKKGGPVFLMMGGEAPIETGFLTVETLPFLQWAIQENAAVVTLEHRFYGWSRPFSEQTTDALFYLSSRQAIEDVASFIPHFNAKMNLNNPKWVVFGGSYSGALAAWVREKHPELVVGAIASSAPLQATLDFHSYLDVVENSLRMMYSNECAKAVRDAFSAMQIMVTYEEGRQNLSRLFNTVPLLERTGLGYNDFAAFFQTMGSTFTGAVQYNRDNVGAYATEGGISNVCKFMVDRTKTPLERLAAANIYMNEFYSGANFTHTYISYMGLVNYLKQDNYGNRNQAASRSWTWQTCTEFGYFQSTDSGNNIFGSGIPNNMFINTCTDVFGVNFDVSRIEKTIKNSLKYYGGIEHYNGTNVVFVNGNVDPWHALGKYSRNDPSVVTYLINGTAHCADMYSPSERDPPGLKVARNLEYENIRKWLSGKKSPSITVESNAAKQSELSKLKEFTSSTHDMPLPDFKELVEESKKLQHREKFLPLFFGGRSFRGMLQPPDVPKNLYDYPRGFKIANITQPVDHFDPSNKATFQQRYFYNPQFYKEGGPIFLMIGGEGKASTWWLLDTEVQIMRSAAMFGAAVFELEHRYYGDSLPTPDSSTANMKWLSSRQALADLARFIQTMNKEYGYQNPKWVTFGGSYPGALSAWMREKYPELIVGAIASSAPVEAKVDFYEYLMVTQRDFELYSDQCKRNIEAAFSRLHQLSTTVDGRITLSNIFTLYPAWTNNSRPTPGQMQYFFMYMSGVLQGAVQYSGDNMGVYAYVNTIKAACDIMTAKGSPLMNFAALNRYMNAELYGYQFDYSYVDYLSFIDYYKGKSFYDEKSWIYQTCTEFGYFQSTDIGYNIFGSPRPVSLDLNYCRLIFGDEFTSDFIYQSINNTRHFYGGADNYKATNVVLPNGSLDPWHALGYYKKTDTVIPFLIKGTAHCADMYPPRPEDVPDLPKVRRIIAENIAKWLGLPSRESFCTK